MRCAGCSRPALPRPSHAPSVCANYDRSKRMRARRRCDQLYLTPRARRDRSAPAAAPSDEPVLRFRNYQPDSEDLASLPRVRA